MLRHLVFRLLPDCDMPCIDGWQSGSVARGKHGLPGVTMALLGTAHRAKHTVPKCAVRGGYAWIAGKQLLRCLQSAGMCGDHQQLPQACVAITIRLLALPGSSHTTHRVPQLAVSLGVPQRRSRDNDLPRGE